MQAVNSGYRYLKKVVACSSVIRVTGNELKKRRKKIGKTQEQLAQDLDVVVSTVARWEQLRDDEIPQSRLIDLSLKQLECNSKR